MANLNRLPLVLTLLLTMAGCAEKEFSEPVEPKSYGEIAVYIDEPVRASLQSTGDRIKTVAWDEKDAFRIYSLEKGISKVVYPSSISEDGFIASLPLPYSKGSIVVTYGSAEFRQDSTLISSSPLEQTLFSEGHDCSTIPMSSLITDIEAGIHKSVRLYPLNSLVETKFSSIPGAGSEKIRNINISTTAARGTRSSNITADAYVCMVDKQSITTEVTDYRSDKYIYADGEYATYVELNAPGLLPYDSGSITAYWQAAPFVQPEGDPQGTFLKDITVSITTDSHVISKTFSKVSDAHIRMEGGHIVKFELNMKGATVTDRKGFSVVWSEGYLKYDPETKGYCFASPEERGLFFKLGSQSGFDPFASLAPEDYFGRSRYLVYYKYRDEDHSVVTSDYDLSWEEGARDLVAYRKDASGEVVKYTPSSYEDIDFKEYSDTPVYDRENDDPCSLVHDPVHKWRLPTRLEVQELADIVQENLGNWKVWSLGSDRINTTDKKPHMIIISDRNGESVTLSTTGNIDHNHSMTSSGKYAGVWTYYVQQSYSESIYIPTSDFLTFTTSKQVKYLGDHLFMIGSLTSLRSEYECDAKVIEAKNSYNAASSKDQGAVMVRCVRDRD